ncbi:MULTISPECIES: PP2C family protein-serine/threonine phosphatase [unclassified Geodermatophilus]|uniref:PP2C family protein-serine/threonine phosphatase n=1 Tax=unclassified Geodermatophilus TaxID=2637632 RepID=UPI003EE9064F
MIRSTPRRVAAVVAVVILAVAAVLAVLAGQVNARAEADSLQRQVAQAGTVLTTQIAVLTTQLADAGQVATATNANPGAFQRFAAARISGANGMSLSLWRIGDGGQAEQVALQGPDPVGPDGEEFAAFLAGVPEDGTLAVTGILPGEPARLGYALRPVGDAGLVVYAESLLPPDRRVQVPPGEAFGGLDFAVYLGRSTATDQLLYSTGPVPIGGYTARTTVPFGNTSITVVGASPTSLTGDLSSALPWIVVGVGLLLAVAAAAAAATMSRRRAEAERLAADNDRLYRQQRSIAATLQHALLPEVPTIDGMEVAARYVAGVDELEVGGDWYDVLPRGTGRCVFVVGDISGRGLPAATTMAELRFAARAYLTQGDDIDVVLAKLRRLLDVAADRQFATVLLGELDASAGRLTVVSAGHFPPVLLTDGRALLLEVPVAPPIGVSGSTPLPVSEFRIPRAGTLLAFTDGLVERRDEVIDAGLDRLRAASAGAVDGRPLPQALDALMRALAVDGGRDDTVLLGMRWTT